MDIDYYGNLGCGYYGCGYYGCGYCDNWYQGVYELNSSDDGSVDRYNEHTSQRDTTRDDSELEDVETQEFAHSELEREDDEWCFLEIDISEWDFSRFWVYWISNRGW